MPDNTTFRILDANFNRSREALRVMEEYARFVLDDPALSEAIKVTRHDLSAALRSLDRNVVAEKNAQLPDCQVARSPDALVSHRDVANDVGRVISVPSEFQRHGAADVAAAAAKRLTEALRAMEEYGKTIDPAFAAAVERLRYRAYDLERRLFATLHARERFGQVRLYVILTESLCHNDWFATAEAALRGGADCLQLREKNLSDRQLFDRARRLAALCRRHDAIFVVNDRPDVALAAGADGVHLGQDDLPVAGARRLLPASCIVGVSTHTAEQIDAAITAAPDYIAVGPMFATATKPQPIVAGPALLAHARTRTALPLVAIGGIDPNNIGLVLAASPCCICVSSAVISQPDPASAAAALRAAVDKSRREQGALI